MNSDPRSIQIPIQKVTGDKVATTSDYLAVEEPLEIRIAFGPAAARSVKPISITMRTPGREPAEDFELALGFLFGEGIIRARADVARFYHCGPETGELHLHNVARIELAPELSLDLARLERHFYTTSSCGVCGKTSIEALRTSCVALLEDLPVVSPAMLQALPEYLREAQSVFDATGGLHAAALFNDAGKLIALREDVGRHNALDKLIGSQFLAGSVPLADAILLLSGRASFELLQKSAMAGIPIVAAIGAPSSLAVQLARQFNIMLVGFLRGNRFNVYSAPQRLAGLEPPGSNAGLSVK
jgi:FdhD protein